MNQELFTFKQLYTALLVSIAPFIIIAPILYFFGMRNPLALLFYTLLILMALGGKYQEFSSCEKLHEKLLAKHGDSYLGILNDELSTTGFSGLLDRKWLGLEPK